MNTARIPFQQTQELKVLPLGSNVIWAERVRAREQADKLLEQARKRARDMLLSARKRASKIEELAREEGIRLGRLEAADIVAEGIGLRNLADERLLPDLIGLAVSIAERLIRRELELQPDLLVGIVRELIRENQLQNQLTIQGHPDDIEILRANEENLSPSASARVQLEPGPGLERGSCRVLSEQGQVDASLDAQLKQLAILLGAD